MRRVQLSSTLTAKIFFATLLSISILAFSNSSVQAANYSVSGRVTDNEGHQIRGVTLELINASNNQLYAGIKNLLNNDGSYLYGALPEGTYNIRITPQESQGYLQKTFANIVVDQNTSNLNFVLDPAPGSVVFTGILKTPLNQPLTTKTVSLSYPSFHNPNITINTGTFTDSSGVYFLRVFPRSDYDLFVSASSPSNLDVPSHFNFNVKPFSLTQNVSQDIVIPTQHVTVHVSNPNGNSASNVSVSPGAVTAAFNLPGIGNAVGTSEAGSNTDSNGNAILKFLPSGPNPPEYVINATPNSGPYFDSRLVTNEEITEGKTFNLTLSDMPTLRFFAASNQTVELIQNNTVVSSYITDVNGFSYIKAPVGTYILKIHSNGEIVNGPDYYEVAGTLDLNQTKQISVSLTNLVSRVSVKVREDGTNTGVPANVRTEGPVLNLSIPGLSNATGFSNDSEETATSDIYASLYLFKTNASASNPGYSITVTPNNPSYLPTIISDFQFNSSVETTAYVTSNQPPVAEANGPYSVNEGASITLQGTATDPDNDQLVYSWDLDNNGTFETNGQTAIFYGIDGNSSHSVTVKACDTLSVCDTDTAVVTVNNVVPIINSISPIESVLPQTEISSSAIFTDVGASDTHTATWDWGDGTTSNAIVNEVNGTGDLTGTHVYTLPGNYTVTLSLSDGVDSSSQTTTTIVLSPTEATSELINIIETFNLQQGIQNNIDAKLDAAINALDDVNNNNDTAAINSLYAFISYVEAQRGNKLTIQQADLLIAEANSIIQCLSL